MFRRLIELITDSRPLQNGRTRGQHLSSLRGNRGSSYAVIFAAGDVLDVQMDWLDSVDGQALTAEDVRTGFQTWLDTAPKSEAGVPLRTIMAWVNGSRRTVTFRTDWVSGFSVVRTR